MYFKKRINKQLCAGFAALAFSLLVSACGGGGGGSSPSPTSTPTTAPQPTTYAVATAAGEGTSISPASASVESGKTASFTVTLLPGYANGSFDGCGTHINLALPGTANFTTETVSANCQITGSATKAPQAFKVSFTADGGSVRNFEGTADITAGVSVAAGSSVEVLMVPDLAHASAGFQSSGSCSATSVSSTVSRITPTGDCSFSVKFFKIDSDHNGVADADESGLRLQWVDMQPHVIRSADVTSKKATLTFTAFLTGSMAMKSDGSLSKIASVKLRTNFSGVGAKVSTGEEEVALYDDGTNGDSKAGDGIWTAKLNPSGDYLAPGSAYSDVMATSTYDGKAVEVHNTLAFYDASGTRLDPVNMKFVTGQGSAVIVLADTVPSSTLTKVSDNIYKSDHFAVLVDPAYAQHDDSKWAGRMASRYSTGSFDFFTKWNLGRSYGMNWSWFKHARRYADGIGLNSTTSGTRVDVDESESYGLSGICGTIDMGGIHIAGRGFNHEVNHCWSAYYDKPEMRLAYGDGHWSAASVVLGPVAVSPTLLQSGSSWKLEWPTIFPSNRVMSMLDMYNAGLASIAEVPSMAYVDEAAFDSRNHANEIVPAQYIHQMTGADLVRIYGTRPLGYAGVKTFRMLTLVIDSQPLTEAEAAYMELMLAHISGTSDGDTVNNTLAPSFTKVCLGRCAFSTDIK